MKYMVTFESKEDEVVSWFSEKFAFLIVTTWVGSSTVWFAKHYYGRVEFNKQSVDVRRMLTVAEARKLNKDESLRDGARGAYKAGDMTGRFCDQALIIEIAKKLYKEEFPEALGLVFGDRAVAEPQLILDGPKEYMDGVNELVKRAEKIGRWEVNEDEMQEICNRWDQLTQKHVG